MSRLLDLWAGMTGTVLDFAGNTAPTGWLMCFGQAVSRTTYSNLFAVIGTSFGAGDGSTTFNLPDYRGRIGAGCEVMGGTAASVISASKAAVITNASAVVTGIADTSDLHIGMKCFSANFPANTTISAINSGTQVTMSAAATSAGTTLRVGVLDGQQLGANGGARGVALTIPQMPSHNHTVNNASGIVTGSGTYDRRLQGDAVSPPVTTEMTGGSQAHANVQPTLIINKIIYA